MYYDIFDYDSAQWNSSDLFLVGILILVALKFVILLDSEGFFVGFRNLFGRRKTQKYILTKKPPSLKGELKEEK